MEYAG
jgi:hypothetical protein